MQYYHFGTLVTIIILNAIYDKAIILSKYVCSFYQRIILLLYYFMVFTKKFEINYFYIKMY